MKLMARLMLVLVVALINLGLGFATAVKVGRGPWSRYARRHVANPPPRSAPVPRNTKSIEQIAGELEVLERRFQELLQQLTEKPSGQITVEQLRTIVRESVDKIESLAVDDLPPEHPEQASAGLRMLLLELQTAATELEEVTAKGGMGITNPIPLVTRLLMACREVGVVFNALMFAELPN